MNCFYWAGFKITKLTEGRIEMNNKIDARYENDVSFNKAVKYILQLIRQSEGELTPLDIREACYLARLIYEREVVRPIIRGFKND